MELLELYVVAWAGGIGGGFEADVVEAGGDEAGGDDGEEGDEEQERAAGGGGFDGRAVELVHGRGGDGDLGEPADDGKLEQRAADAGCHQEHGAGEGDGGELRAWRRRRAGSAHRRRR